MWGSSVRTTAKAKSGTTSGTLVEEGSAVRSAIVKFLATGLVVLAIVSIPFSFWVRAVSRELALEDAVELTQRLADYVISPVVDVVSEQPDPEVLSRIDSRLAPWLADESIVRIKVWSAEGTILYSDRKELAGSRFDLEPWAHELLAGGPGVATVEVQEEEENLFESGDGELVEVYVASSSAEGVPLLFEVYFDDVVVRGPENQFLLGMIPVLLGAGAVLQGGQLIPGIRLARQVQKHQRERRAILQQTIAAGERERMRLAAALHDDIIQDLAGLAYVLEPSPDLGPTIAPGAVLQATIGKLRGITAELYSSSVTADELPRALGILAERARSQGIRTVVQIDQPLPFDDRQSTMFHRIARESVLNVIKHSGAKNMELHLMRLGRNWGLNVRDDGVGFGSSDRSASDHFGLRLMADFAETAGARLEITSTLDKGTSISVRVSTSGSTANRSVVA